MVRQLVEEEAKAVEREWAHKNEERLAAAAGVTSGEMTGLVADMKKVLATCSATQVAEVEAAAAEAALQLETFNRQAEDAIQSVRDSLVTVDFPRFDAVTIRSTKKYVGNAAREAAASVARARAAFDAAETAVRAANSSLKASAEAPAEEGPLTLEPIPAGQAVTILGDPTAQKYTRAPLAAWLLRGQDPIVPTTQEYVRNLPGARKRPLGCK